MKPEADDEPWDRRRFCRVIVAGVAGMTTVSEAAAEPSEIVRAAVIGHTSRGDYGHGIEKVFLNRAGIEVVALADPD